MTKILFAEDFTQEISQIISPKGGIGGLYLGNIHATKNPHILQKYNITSVISINLAKKFNHLSIKLDDSPFSNILQHFNICLNFIQKNIKHGNVFVHCVAGISRSSTVIIAYLMKHKKYSLKHAFDKVKRKRSIIKPNKGFFLQLEQYEKLINKKPNQKMK